MDYETFKRQPHPLWRALRLPVFIVGGCFALLFAWAQIGNWVQDNAVPANTLKNAPVADTDPLVAQVVSACPGLRKYQADWSLVQSDHDQGKVEILMGSPLKEMPASYFATGHHCYFEVGGDRPDRVAVWKRPCVSACLDEPSTVPTSTLIDIK